MDGAHEAWKALLLAVSVEFGVINKTEGTPLTISLVPLVRSCRHWEQVTRVPSCWNAFWAPPSLAQGRQWAWKARLLSVWDSLLCPAVLGGSRLVLQMSLSPSG